MLIVRLLADPATLGVKLDAARAELAERGWPVAMAEPARSGEDAIELLLPAGDPARVRAVIDRHLGPCDLLVSDRPI